MAAPPIAGHADTRRAYMHLHTRLLLGIAVVTLLALAVSVLEPLSSARQEVARETQNVRDKFSAVFGG